MPRPKKSFKPTKRRPGDPKHNGSYRKESLRRLKATWKVDHPDEEWCPEKEPVITPMLEAAEGGIDAVITALRVYDHEDARQFVEFYESLSSRDKKSLTVEQIAYASGTGSLRLAGLAAEAIVSFGQSQTQILMGSSMHKVMKSTIKAATDEIPIVADMAGARVVVGKTNGDVRAQEMFHKMTGMMPLPKGAQIAIQNNFGRSEDKGDDDAPSQGWRSADDRLREIYVVTEQKALEAPKEQPTIISGRGSVEFEHARS